MRVAMIHWCFWCRIWVAMIMCMILFTWIFNVGMVMLMSAHFHFNTLPPAKRVNEVIAMMNRQRHADFLCCHQEHDCKRVLDVQHLKSLQFYSNCIFLSQKIISVTFILDEVPDSFPLIITTVRSGPYVRANPYLPHNIQEWWMATVEFDPSISWTLYQT